MSHVHKLWIEGYVLTLSGEKYSYFIIQESCDMHDIKISKFKISDIFNQTLKNRQLFLLPEKKTPNAYTKKVRIISNLPNVKILVTR